MTNGEKIALITAYCKVHNGRKRQYSYDLANRQNNYEDVVSISKKLKESEIETMENIKKVIETKED